MIGDRLRDWLTEAIETGAIRKDTMTSANLNRLF